MELHELYRGKSLEFLVRILEHAQDYEPEALQVAADVLKERNDGSDAIKAIALEMMNDRLTDYFDNFSVLNDELTLPVSNILSKEEIMPVFTKLFEEWKAENDSMIPDGFSYVLGAGFG